VAFQPEAAQVDDFTVFDHPGAYLVADYSLDCGACDVATRALLAPSAEYERVRTLAYVAILLFPFGVPCFYLVLLLRNRRALIRSQHTEMTKALAFLCKEYEPEWFWWEIVEVAKKMLLVGFFALEPFHPGTITQLVVALLVCLTFMMLQMQAAPFRNHEDDFLSMATSFSLVLVFFMSVILKQGSLQEGLPTHMPMHAHAHAHTRTHACPCTPTHAHARPRTPMHAHACQRIPTHAHSRTRASPLRRRASSPTSRPSSGASSASRRGGSPSC